MLKPRQIYYSKDSDLYCEIKSIEGEPPFVKFSTSMEVEGEDNILFLKNCYGTIESFEESIKDGTLVFVKNALPSLYTPSLMTLLSIAVLISAFLTGLWFGKYF